MKRIPVLPGLGLLALVWALVGPALTVVDSTGRSLCLTALDVGQGDSLLLELPGETWLVDGGGAPGSRRDVGEERVLPELRSRGIDRLDRVVLTHGDADHIGGLFAVLEQLDVGELLVPTRKRLSSAERMLLALARRQGVAVLVADEDAVLGPLPGGVHGALLHPVRGWEAADSRDRNAGSVVFRVGLGGIDFLLTGDIEAETERNLVQRGVLTPAAVLKLAHHGSRTSTTEEFLAAVDPLVVLAGAGRENRFGFPHTSVVQRLRARDAAFYWTGRHGAHRVCTDGFGLQLVPIVGGQVEFEPWAASPAAVAAWQSRIREVRAPEPEPSTPKRLGAPRRRTKATPPRRAARRPESLPQQAPALLDERAWRSRRKSSRMKAPWK